MRALAITTADLSTLRSHGFAIDHSSTPPATKIYGPYARKKRVRVRAPRAVKIKHEWKPKRSLSLERLRAGVDLGRKR